MYRRPVVKQWVLAIVENSLAGSNNPSEAIREWEENKVSEKREREKCTDIIRLRMKFSATLLFLTVWGKKLFTVQVVFLEFFTVSNLLCLSFLGAFSFFFSIPSQFFIFLFKFLHSFGLIILSFPLISISFFSYIFLSWYFILPFELVFPWATRKTLREASNPIAGLTLWSYRALMIVFFRLPLSYRSFHSIHFDRRQFVRWESVRRCEERKSDW